MSKNKENSNPAVTTGKNQQPKPHNVRRSNNWKRNDKTRSKELQKVPDGRGTKQQRRGEEIIDTAVHMSRSNPVEFYDKYKAFATDAATLPFSTPLGATLAPHWGTGSFQKSFTIPGVMRLRFSMVPGVSEDFTSPLNRSSIQLWTYLRSVQKSAASYDHQDVTMYLLALDSCVAFHSMLTRAYGLLRDVTPMNLYYPNALIAAAGFTPSDLRANIADFRMYINSFAISLKKFFIPKGISLMERHQWMSQGIYTDSEGVRAQTYMFVPQFFWQYDNTVESGSQLVQKAWMSTEAQQNLRHSFQEVKEFGNALINAITNDEDFAFISGDLYSLYNGAGLELAAIDEMYTILPAYDRRVLSQIENATFSGVFETSQNITQNPSVNAGAIIFAPRYFTYSESSFNSHISYMNMHQDVVTPDDVLEATRLITINEQRGQYMYVKHCGTEVVNAIDIFRIKPGDAKLVEMTSTYHNDRAISINDTAAHIVQELHDFMLANVYDWAPRMVVVYSNDQTEEIIGTTWDIDNFAPIPNDQLAMIHEAALWSEFKVPEGRLP